MSGRFQSTQNDPQRMARGGGGLSRPMNCNQCNFSTSIDSIFTKHMELYHNNSQDNKCPTCPFHSSNGAIFEKHLQICKGKELLNAGKAESWRRPNVQLGPPPPKPMNQPPVSMNNSKFGSFQNSPHGNGGYPGPTGFRKGRPPIGSNINRFPGPDHPSTSNNRFPAKPSWGGEDISNSRDPPRYQQDEYNSMRINSSSRMERPRRMEEDEQRRRFNGPNHPMNQDNYNDVRHNPPDDNVPPNIPGLKFGFNINEEKQKLNSIFDLNNNSRARPHFESEDRRPPFESEELRGENLKQVYEKSVKNFDEKAWDFARDVHRNPNVRGPENMFQGDRTQARMPEEFDRKYNGPENPSNIIPHGQRNRFPDDSRRNMFNEPNQDFRMPYRRNSEENPPNVPNREFGNDNASERFNDIRLERREGGMQERRNDSIRGYENFDRNVNNSEPDNQQGNQPPRRLPAFFERVTEKAKLEQQNSMGRPTRTDQDILDREKGFAHPNNTRAIIDGNSRFDQNSNDARDLGENRPGVSDFQSKMMENSRDRDDRVDRNETNYQNDSEGYRDPQQRAMFSNNDFIPKSFGPISDGEQVHSDRFKPQEDRPERYADQKGCDRNNIDANRNLTNDNLTSKDNISDTISNEIMTEKQKDDERWYQEELQKMKILKENHPPEKDFYVWLLEWFPNWIPTFPIAEEDDAKAKEESNSMEKNDATQKKWDIDAQKEQQDSNSTVSTNIDSLNTVLHTKKTDGYLENQNDESRNWGAAPNKIGSITNLENEKPLDPKNISIGREDLGSREHDSNLQASKRPKNDNMNFEDMNQPLTTRSINEGNVQSKVDNNSNGFEKPPPNFDRIEKTTDILSDGKQKDIHNNEEKEKKEEESLNNKRKRETATPGFECDFCSYADVSSQNVTEHVMSVHLGM